ncbi:MAG: Gfo/Idh/MocA family oxidoreductase [Lentisphaerae bacterium]|nr:Gfo/Idh/MocA family oxidoreductase [Lentisphaerota bacterium]
MNRRRRFAQVGLGGRHVMYRDAVVNDFAGTCEMVALCDSNSGRLALSIEQIKQKFNQNVSGYLADDFDRMVKETKPDTIIVTTKDSLHDQYICRAMELGCDVVSEKPMTIDAVRCQKILDTQRATGKSVRVTFNYRYSPPRAQVKDLLMSGVIGDILSVDFHWMLDIHHGADYFRRWHRNKENSGGLLVHKATHHFDLVNWWLGTVPETVYASGHRHFYTPETAKRYGLKHPGPRCHGCAEAEKCRFCLNMENTGSMKELYLDCEKHDGYFRDMCVFSPKIDIEDNMNVVVSYRNGVKMSYSLNAFMPWEGYHISFNGTRGRLEHKCEESVYVSGDDSVQGALKKEGTWTKIYPHWKPSYGVDVWAGEGGHGGGDELLLKNVLVSDNVPDKYMRAADHRAGAWSILTGVAANHSIKTGLPVRVVDLVSGLDEPNYAPMPTSDEPLTMVLGNT